MDMVGESENLESQMKVENVKFGSICFTFSNFIDVPTTCQQMQHQSLEWSLIDLILNKNLMENILLKVLLVTFVLLHKPLIFSCQIRLLHDILPHQRF